jgi:DNA repair exonuclease SbcCD ATPase subunit
MTTLKKYLYLSCLILASYCTIALSQEPDPNAQKLQFEISKEQPDWLPELIANDEATHIAYLKFRQDRDFNQISLEALDTEASKSVSEKQRSFLLSRSRDKKKSLGWIPTSDGRRGRVSNEVHIPNFYINAVSEDDARKMTEVLIEYFNKIAWSKMEYRRKELEEKLKAIPELENQLAELEKEYKSLNESQIDKILDECWQRKYDLVSEENMSQDLAKTMKEIKDKLRLLNYDSSNLQAKIYKIQQLNKSGVQIHLDKLHDLLTTYEIELTGLVSESEAAQKSFAEEEKLADALHKIKRKRELPSLIKQTNKNLTDNQFFVQYYERELTYPPAQCKPVEVIDNKVTIYQLPPKQPTADSPAPPLTVPRP